MSTQDHLVIAGREFGSRLLTGTGKYDTFETMREALAASGSAIVTVAVRRIDLDAPGDDLPPTCPTMSCCCPTPPAARPPRRLCGPHGSRGRAGSRTGSSSR